MITNLNPLSAADPISSRNAPQEAKGQQAQDSNNDERVFKTNLDDQLAVAGGIEAAQSQGQRMAPVNPQLYTQNSGKNSAQTPNLAEQGEVIGRPGKATIARMSDAEYLPTTTKVASSVNTASSIAGLKPWDQNWVFEGNPKASEEVRPLFGASDSEIGLAEARDALTKLGIIAGLQGGDAKNLNPGAAQVSDNLRTRSDADTAQLQAVQAALVNPDGTPIAPGTNAALVQMNPLLRSQMPNQLREMNGSMTLKSGKPGPNATNAVQLKGASGLSGAEFMKTLSMVQPGAQKGQEFTQQDMSSGGGGSRPELTLIEGAKTSKGMNPNEDLVLSSAPGSYSGLHSLTQSQPQQLSATPTIVTGHVVPGSMAQEQLSHEAILGMTTGIRDLSAQGGGEMRIRLKPENLGELHLRVVTQGNEVGLQIHASDDKAKRILQDSIGGLKDSLASQNLTLGKVEFSVVASTGGHASHHESRDGTGQQQASAQSQYQQSLGQNTGQGRNQQSTLWNDPESGLAAQPLKSAVGSSGLNNNGSTNARTASGRLDVMA